MDTVNRTLLAEVTKKRLEEALSEGDDEKREIAFKEAMVAVEKEIEIEKNKTDRIIQIGTFSAGLVLTPLVDFAFKKAFAKMLCEFEKDYTFTTTAGRSLSSLFRFKK